MMEEGGAQWTPPVVLTRVGPSSPCLPRWHRPSRLVRFPLPFLQSIQALSQTCGCVLPRQGICDRRKAVRSTSLCAAGVVHACGSAPKPDIKPPLQKRILPEQGLSAVMANTGVDVSLGARYQGLRDHPGLRQTGEGDLPSMFPPPRQADQDFGYDVLALSRCASLIPPCLNCRPPVCPVVHSLLPSYRQLNIGEAQCVCARARMHPHEV